MATTNVAKDINKGLRASKAASDNLTKVILGHKDPIEWRLESTKVGLAKLVKEIQEAAQSLTEATGNSADIDSSYARRLLSILLDRTMSASSWLSRIDELEMIQLDLKDRK